MKINGDFIELNPKYTDSWEKSIQFFEMFTQNLFKGKKKNPMTYEYEKGGKMYQRYLSEQDLQFLIGIGIRYLIEESYKNNVFLVGIAKDSSSNLFFSRYINSLNNEIQPNHGCYPAIDHLKKPIPWSDRICFESIPRIDSSINSPWSSVEYDSVFMSLSISFDEKEEINRLRGLQGFNINPPERLFLRSLGQFFVDRSGVMRQGHVIFIDRLVHQMYDRSLAKITLEGNKWGKEDRWGVIQPFLHENNQFQNQGQEIMIFILDILTKNLFPEVIGYPDPLHKADWGAKTLLRRVQPMILSSESKAKRDPLIQKFRKYRESERRV
ncbi:MAG: hypothetical protein INQ03_10560 [Candidatus Heimdallarchaeota archaeon]|nr:hypothetical protein [Candidatus Heimdallarchaeota archaeon]